MRVGRFLRVHRTWAVGDALAARFGLYAYLEPLNDWRPQYESTFALLYGPKMLVGLTQTAEHTIRGSPADVRRWTNVTHCGAAGWTSVRLSAPNAASDAGRLELMALSAVVEQTYSAFFRVA